MAVNIFGGQPNAAVAKVTASFASMGLNSTNTAIVYEIGYSLRSWRPTRLINGILGIVENRGYYVIALDDMDLETYFAAPLGNEITTQLLLLLEKLLPTVVSSNQPSITIGAGDLISGIEVQAPTAVTISVGTTVGGQELVEPILVSDYGVFRVDFLPDVDTEIYFTGFVSDTIFTILK